VHEYSIVQALLAKVAAEARARGARRVRRVRVRIGELAGVETELLATAFETFRERSICEGARLEIRAIRARWRCPRCLRRGKRGGPLRCARCGSPLELLQGDDIVLERIEMEVN
jgi:hydrogenase nickel incorporation protein HypA/HybF